MTTRRRTNEFGTFLRQRRAKEGVSLNKLAKAIGISPVYLSEIERGARGPLDRKHWPSLLASLPKVTEHELEQYSALSRPMQLDLASAPPRYRDLGLALARRIKRQDLSASQMRELLRVLGDEDDD